MPSDPPRLAYPFRPCFNLRRLLCFIGHLWNVTLSVNHRVDGKSNDQACFRDLLNRARYGESTIADWQTLLSRTPENITNIEEFLSSSVRLSYLKSKVAEMNLIKFKKSEPANSDN